MVILYGTQTGTATGFAFRLMMRGMQVGVHSVLLDPGRILRYQEFVKLATIPKHVLVFVVATYWDGNPTNNTTRLDEWLKSTPVSLKGVNYAVFGLGDSGYTYFNGFGKFVDRRMDELGATRVHELGLGDAALGIEDDFQHWKESFTKKVLASYGEAAKTDKRSQYELKVLSKVPEGEIFKGEPTPQSSYCKQWPPYNSFNPFLARVVEIEELFHPKAGRSCLKITLDVTGSRFFWSPANHIGIYVQNNHEDVNLLAKLLRIDTSHIIEFCHRDKEELMFKHRFPCPCSLETALMFYLDINRPPSAELLTELAKYTNDASQRRALSTLGSADGRDEYRRFVIGGFQTLLTLLKAFPACHPPLELLLELLPRLQPRYYSIASSPKRNKNEVVFIATIVKEVVLDVPYNTNDRVNKKHYHLFRGVATSLLAQFGVTKKSPFEQASVSSRMRGKHSFGMTSMRSRKRGPLLPVFIRQGRVNLPPDNNSTIIMICAGTGISPFIGFIEDRQMNKKAGNPIGKVILYYGCRRPDEDFLYEDYLRSMVKADVINELNVAFSRQTHRKIYVQHLMRKNKETLWDLMIQEEAYVFVSGDARTMAKDVETALEQIAVECGGWIDGSDFILDLKVKGRYQRDVWTSPYAQPQLKS